MASPQPDKFTRFSNELLEAIMTVKMSGSEWQFVMCLFRKTYGFNKTEDWITGSQIVLATGLKKERVSEAKKKLLARNMVTEKRNKLSIQKDYEKWVELRKSVTKVTEKRNKVLRKSVNTKDNKDKRQLSDSDESLKSNQEKNMAWKKYEEPTLDYDSGDVIEDEQSKEKEENKKITNNLKVLADIRNLPFADLPTQRKKYREIMKLGYTHLDIAEKYNDLLESKYWQEQKKTRKQLPDMKSLHSTLKNIINE